MYEVLVHTGPQCEEAIVAFLEENQIQTAVKADDSGVVEGILFYLGAQDWDSFRGRFGEKLREIARIFRTAPPDISVRSVEESAWRNAWKRYARIYRFGEDLIVKPTWRKLRKRPACPVLSIDPQMAFGTGGHASTRLCVHHLRWIRRERPRVLRRVLDVGTGSGILAMVAVLFGAGRVVATDIDPEALRVARENADRNGIAGQIDFTAVPLREVPGTYSLILANIYESVLTELLEEFVRHLEPGGILVVSGLLSNQGKPFLDRVLRVGLRRDRERHSGSWISYALEAAP